MAEGDKIPRKRGPGVTNSDLLVINKIDLAPYVRASLEVMERDARAVRGERPFVLTNCFTGEGLDEVVDQHRAGHPALHATAVLGWCRGVTPAAASAGTTAGGTRRRTCPRR